MAGFTEEFQSTFQFVIPKFRKQHHNFSRGFNRNILRLGVFGWRICLGRRVRLSGGVWEDGRRRGGRTVRRWVNPDFRCWRQARERSGKHDAGDQCDQSEPEQAWSNNAANTER